MVFKEVCARTYTVGCGRCLYEDAKDKWVQHMTYARDTPSWEKYGATIACSGEGLQYRAHIKWELKPRNILDITVWCKSYRSSKNQDDCACYYMIELGISGMCDDSQKQSEGQLAATDTIVYKSKQKARGRPWCTSEDWLKRGRLNRVWEGQVHSLLRPTFRFFTLLIILILPLVLVVAEVLFVEEGLRQLGNVGYLELGIVHNLRQRLDVLFLRRQDRSERLWFQEVSIGRAQRESTSLTLRSTVFNQSSVGISNVKTTYRSPFESGLLKMGIPSPLRTIVSRGCMIFPGGLETLIPRPSRCVTMIRENPRSASESVMVACVIKSAPARSNESCFLVLRMKVTSPGGTPGYRSGQGSS